MRLDSLEYVQSLPPVPSVQDRHGTRGKRVTSRLRMYLHSCNSSEPNIGERALHHEHLSTPTYEYAHEKISAQLLIRRRRRRQRKRKRKREEKQGEEEEENEESEEEESEEGEKRKKENSILFYTISFYFLTVVGIYRDSCGMIPLAHYFALCYYPVST
ncbi:hypothetical protein GGR52DRAFT_192494 [Hypoxylon sp. FL1284]|nr:hypothetical protein GGR52DRAFT_192494 [Hypoxylon sp. FL1284]